MLMTLVSETSNTHVILSSQYDSTCVLSVGMTWKTMATTTFHPSVRSSIRPSVHPSVRLYVNPSDLKLIPISHLIKSLF